MNWYKISQFYEDIKNNPGEYGEEHFDANLYFSIGQNEETYSQSFCWIWRNGLKIAQGPTTHRMSFGKDVDNYYRGWYDPVQKLLSVQPPSNLYNRVKSEEDLPKVLIRSLRNKFGQDFDIKVF